MFEQKKAKHSEQKMASLTGKSPEVSSDRKSNIFDHSDTIDKESLHQTILKDRRSAGQVFESLRQEIITSSGGKVSDEEATKAARRLVGLFETVLEIKADHRSFGLDETENER